MILESLQKIKKTETDVIKRIEDAKKEAVKIVEDAKKDAEKILTEKRQAAKAREDKMISDAIEEAKKNGKSVADDWEKRIQDLEKDAVKNTEKATEFILHSVLD
jgi:vacuolar-type H+-ATPase subunit H